jgi:DNA ligase-1
MLEDGTIKVFSRNQEDNTEKYPDIIDRLKGSLKEDVKTCIIDSEAVAYDREQMTILPFQVLSTRKKKVRFAPSVDETIQEELFCSQLINGLFSFRQGAELESLKVQACVFAFDLLYLNGESLIRLPFKERRDKLKSIVVEKEGEFSLASHRDTNNTDEIQEFLDEAIKCMFKYFLQSHAYGYGHGDNMMAFLLNMLRIWYQRMDS